MPKAARVKSAKKIRTNAKPTPRAKAHREAAAAPEAMALPASAKAKRRGAPAKPATREWVLERLTENVRRAMQIEPVTLRGTPTGDFRYEGSVANRALELLGKELGLFVERNESVNTHHVVSGEPITEAKWEERYAKAR
ncbi:MAG: hypothetical protein JO188_14155 [Hyphomicrobiales bacterium]|nr:hypothetical protein [Hyphomicrobiales bacterium]